MRSCFGKNKFFANANPLNQNLLLPSSFSNVPKNLGMSISRLLIFLAILTWVQPSEAIGRDRYGSLHKKALKKGNYAKCLRKAERRFKRDSTLTGLIYLN
jgi:hypothetical protein